MLRRRHLAARLAKWNGRIGAEAAKQFYDGQLLYVGGSLLGILLVFVDIALSPLHQKWPPALCLGLLVCIAIPSLLIGTWKIAQARRLVRDRYALSRHAMRTLRVKMLNSTALFDDWLARRQADSAS